MQYDYRSDGIKGYLDYRKLDIAYFKYSALRFLVRHHRQLKLNADIDEHLLDMKDDHMNMFRDYTENHVCDVKGCESVLVVDGHMKAHRKICKDRKCDNDPIVGKLYCSSHQEESGRRICEGVQETRDVNEYHVECIVGKEYIKKHRQWRYRVKWVGYEELTLEPRSHLPRILVEVFNRYGRSNVSSKMEYGRNGDTEYVKV